MPANTFGTTIGSIANAPAATASGGGITSDLAAANLAAAPDLERLTNLVNQINQQSWMAAPGRKEALGNIQNLLAGNLDPQTIQAAQMNAAQQYGARGGFSTDSGAWQSAIQRALGTNRQALQEQGLKDLQTLYQGMPVAAAQDYTYTPTTWNQKIQISNQHAQAMAELSERMREFNVSTAEQSRQFAESLAQKNAAEMAGLSVQMRGQDLAASQEAARLAQQSQEFADTLANRRGEFTATQAQQASQFASSLAQQQTEFTNNLAQRQAEFGTTTSLQQQELAQRQSQFNANLAQDQARLYAQLYGTLPGYNQYGQYTGQTGVFPTATSNAAPFDLDAYARAQMNALNQWTWNLGRRG